MTQLTTDDVTTAREAYDRARKANNGRISLRAARLYDAVHRELAHEFPASRQADQSLSLSVGA